MTSLRASVTPDLLLAANRASTLEAVFRWMVHDLRNPAQTLAFIPAMWEDRPSAEDRRWLDALAVACDRLTGDIALIDRLLGGTAERRPPEPVALDDVLGFVSRLVGVRRGSLTVEVAPGPRSLLPPVTAVRRDLEAAVLNLVLNAVEAGARQVWLSVVLHPEAMDLTVEDDGPGVPEPFRSRLFEPFATTKDDGSGRGLGLYAARHLLARSGGSVWFEAGATGSRFIVRLPVWHASAP